LDDYCLDRQQGNCIDTDIVYRSATPTHSKTTENKPPVDLSIDSLPCDSNIFEDEELSPSFKDIALTDQDLDELSVNSTPQWTSFGSKIVIKHSEEYCHRRRQNNQAVKRARQKAKEKTEVQKLKMAMLVNENQQLIARIVELTKELTSLKSSFVAFSDLLRSNKS
jgi:hypothetical protein